MPANPKRDHQAELLHWALVDIQTLGEALVRREDWALRPDGPVRSLGSEYIPSWWSKVDEQPYGPRDRQAFSRATKTLEAAGLLVLIRAYECRLTHVRITPLGLKVAMKLNGDWVNRRAVATALRATAWGMEEHLAAIGEVDAHRDTKPKPRRGAAGRAAGKKPPANRKDAIDGKIEV